MQQYDSSNKFYDSRATIDAIPSYRQLARDNPLREKIDAALLGLDYTSPDSILAFGAEGANEIIGKITEKYQDAARSNHLETKISDILSSKLGTLDAQSLAEMLKKADLQTGKAYRKTEGLVGKMKGFFGKESEGDKAARIARETLAAVALKVDEQNTQLDENIETAEQISAAIDDEFNGYNDLKSHYLLHYIALVEAKQRLAEDARVKEEFDPQIVDNLDLMLTQKASNNVENLLATSATQRTAYATSQALKLSCFTLKEYKASGLELVRLQLGTANLSLGAAAVSQFTGNVRESKILLVETTVDASKNVLGSAMSSFEADHTKRYTNALQKADAMLERSQAALTNYRQNMLGGQTEILGRLLQNNDPAAQGEQPGRLLGGANPAVS